MVLSRTGILFAAVLGMAQIAAADYTITDLGTLPLTDFHGSGAYGINASGQVVGSAIRHIPRIDEFYASLWQNGKMSSLGTINNSFAMGINASGQVVGREGSSGFFWQNGKVTQLGFGNAFGINDSGQVVGANLGGAYVWQNGTFTQLGPGGARGINASGQIVGSSNSHAVLWQNGTMTDLGTLGGNFSDAYGINGSGIVVGLSFAADQSMHAFLWQAGKITDLGPGIANAINDSGEVVGGTNDDVLRIGNALLWQNGAVEGPQHLNTPRFRLDLIRCNGP